MASSPTFGSTPRGVYCQVSTADTSRTSPTNQATLITAVAAGTLVTRITAVATGTTTAGVIRLWESNDGGTTKRLLEEILVAAITPGTSAAVWMGRFRSASLSQPLVMGASTNNVLYVTTNNTETFNVFAEGFDLT